MARRKKKQYFSRNFKASSAGNVIWHRRDIDMTRTHKTNLSKVRSGEMVKFENGQRWYRVRTSGSRGVILEASNGKKYLVSGEKKYANVYVRS